MSRNISQEIQKVGDIIAHENLPSIKNAEEMKLCDTAVHILGFGGNNFKYFLGIWLDHIYKNKGYKYFVDVNKQPLKNMTRYLEATSKKLNCSRTYLVKLIQIANYFNSDEGKLYMDKLPKIIGTMRKLITQGRWERDRVKDYTLALLEKKLSSTKIVEELERQFYVSAYKTVDERLEIIVPDSCKIKKLDDQPKKGFVKFSVVLKSSDIKKSKIDEFEDHVKDYFGGNEL